MWQELSRRLAEREATVDIERKEFEAALSEMQKQGEDAKEEARSAREDTKSATDAVKYLQSRLEQVMEDMVTQKNTQEKNEENAIVYVDVNAEQIAEEPHTTEETTKEPSTAEPQQKLQHISSRRRHEIYRRGVGDYEGSKGKQQFGLVGGRSGEITPLTESLELLSFHKDRTRKRVSFVEVPIEGAKSKSDREIVKIVTKKGLHDRAYNSWRRKTVECGEFPRQRVYKSERQHCVRNPRNSSRSGSSTCVVDKLYEGDL
ncbi:hypothetical protein Droror1_Dr00027851 [Drosera rotundifolia]